MKRVIKNLVKCIIIISVCGLVLCFVGCQKEPSEAELMLILEEIDVGLEENKYPALVEADIDYEKLQIVIYIDEEHKDKDKTIENIKKIHSKNIQIIVGDYHATTTQN